MLPVISFVWTWMRLKSGSLWPGVVFHAAHNTFIQQFFDPLTVDNSKTRYVAGEFGAALAVISVLMVSVSRPIILRWAWDHDTIELFRRLDSELWESTGHNPVRMLGMMHQCQLEAAARDESFLAHVARTMRELETYLSVESTWTGAPTERSTD